MSLEQKPSSEPLHISAPPLSVPATLLRFRGGLASEDHRTLYHSTLGSSVIRKKRRHSFRDDFGSASVSNPSRGTFSRQRVCQTHVVGAICPFDVSSIDTPAGTHPFSISVISLHGDLHTHQTSIDYLCTLVYLVIYDF